MNAFNSSGKSCCPRPQSSQTRNASPSQNPFSSSVPPKTAEKTCKSVPPFSSNVSLHSPTERPKSPVKRPSGSQFNSSDIVSPTKTCPSVHLIVRLPGERIKEICERLLGGKYTKSGSDGEPIKGGRKSARGCESQSHWNKKSPASMSNLFMNQTAGSAPADVRMTVHLPGVDVQEICQWLTSDITKPRPIEQKRKDCYTNSGGGKSKTNSKLDQAYLYIDNGLKQARDKEKHRRSQKIEELKCSKLEMLEAVDNMIQILAGEERRNCQQDLKNFFKYKCGEMKKFKESVIKMFGKLQQGMEKKENSGNRSEEASFESTAYCELPNGWEGGQKKNMNTSMKCSWKEKLEELVKEYPIPNSETSECTLDTVFESGTASNVSLKLTDSKISKKTMRLDCLECSEQDALTCPVSVEKVRAIRSKLSQMCSVQYRKVICALQEDNKEFCREMDRNLKSLNKNQFKSPPAREYKAPCETQVLLRTAQPPVAEKESSHVDLGLTFSRSNGQEKSHGIGDSISSHTKKQDVNINNLSSFDMLQSHQEEYMRFLASKKS